MAKVPNLKVQCPCGREINHPSEYKLLLLKLEMKEIDILCPNDVCYLRELGYVKFDIKDSKLVFKEAVFYPPFVTWNASQLGSEKAEELLKLHLRILVSEVMDWSRIKETYFRYYTAAGERREEVSPEGSEV